MSDTQFWVRVFIGMLAVCIVIGYIELKRNAHFTKLCASVGGTYVSKTCFAQGVVLPLPPHVSD